jgi:hypothetical protein
MHEELKTLLFDNLKKTTNYNVGNIFSIQDDIDELMNYYLTEADGDFDIQLDNREDKICSRIRELGGDV